MDQLPFEPPPAPTYEDPDAPEQRPLSPLAYVLMFPAALVAAAIGRVLVLPDMIADGVRLWMHEWGHAFVAWACGWVAIPLPIGFTPWSPERSWLVIIVWHVLWGVWTWRTFVAQHYVASGIGAAALVAQWVCAFGLNQSTQEAWALFGGCAGELVLSAAWMGAFHLRFAPRTRFSWWRWPLLFFGASVYAKAFGLWYAAHKSAVAIPFGSMWGDDSDGDMNRLIDQHHWNMFALANRYYVLAIVCGVAVFAICLVRAVQRKRELDDGV